ncbi:hypothetical protein FANTH_8720 [Fusarium anthophilum]|uniref:SNF2 N-terminal domain-containing protein n=1 Tax=Fusarium anthophilum TaxID=48485 RepID=A0A8H5E0G1_9HYPO|nr:hypothetical protein FANTH_8720 [Fusarium anthophilum]
MGPTDGSNDHTHTTAIGDGDDSEGEDEDEDGGDIDEKGVVTYLNTLHDMIPWKPVGKYMILDEAPTIKNRNSRTFVAVTTPWAIRRLSILTGTSLDNTWEDGYALPSLLEGHPITDFNTLQKTFKELEEMAPRHHTGKHMTRYIQMLDAASFSNPISTLQDRLPLRTGIVLRFALASEDRRKSEEESCNTGNLYLQLKLAHKYLMEPMRQEDIGDAIPDDTVAQALAQVAEWCQHLEQGDNSLSRRVQAILNIVRQDLDFRPDNSFIIVDESVWFLDIVAIVLKKIYHPVGHDTYNARLDTVQRHLTIKKWKKAWEQQAARRVHRPEQQKPTFIYELRAQDFALGDYKMEDK